MKRVATRAVMLHEFTFNADELRPFKLESDKLSYMENCAREHLETAGMPHEDGECVWWLSYDERPSTLTLYI